MTPHFSRLFATVGWVGVVAICLVGLWVIAEMVARAVSLWALLRRARRALLSGDFGSSEEARAFEHLYKACVRYRDQTDSRDSAVAAEAILRELPRMREAAARYRKAVISANIPVKIECFVGNDKIDEAVKRSLESKKIDEVADE